MTTPTDANPNPSRNADSDKTALIIGATGAFGGHAAAALIKHGWRILALARDPEAARRKAGERMPIEWIAGDAMRRADVIAAAAGARIIVHAANPPGYRNWAGTVLPMIDNTIAAAKVHGGRIVLPGNVYNFAPDAGPMIAEDHVQAPATRKGKIRAQMEARLGAAAASHGVRTLVVRAGDFFGPGAPMSALSWLTSRKRGRVTSIYATGPADVGHAFAYLPDLAEATAQLCKREGEMADFAAFHFAGSWLTPAQLAEAIRAATGDPVIPLRAFPWPAIALMAPFNETMRELLEMRYLWRSPIGLDGTKLAAFVGETAATPLVCALRASLPDLGVEEGVVAGADATAARGGAGKGRAKWNTFDLATPA